MKIQTGIASTTHRDRVGDKFAKSALDSMAVQINAKYIPLRLNHDPKKGLGVLFYGEVFQLADGEYALGVVSGILKNKKERAMYLVGDPNTVSETFGRYIDIDSLRLMHQLNSSVPDPIKSIDKSKLSIDKLLALYLDSTRVDDEGRVYEIKKFVDTTGGLRIEVYPKDHEHESHYHVISRQRKLDARFDLNTHQLISVKSGKIRQEDIKKIQKFFEHKANFEKLINTHKSINS